jgi:hypothetical protein
MKTPIKGITPQISMLLMVAFFISGTNALGNFTLPIWHPDAKWSVPSVPEIGSGAIGRLDGPRLETMSAEAYWTGEIVGGPGAGPYGFLYHDTSINRIHLAAFSDTRGYLDGPFGRARMASISYTNVRSEASFGKRYYYFSEPQNGHVIRCMDFVKQEVSTVAAGLISAGMTVDSSGRLYVKTRLDSILHIISMDGTIETKKLEIREMAGSSVAVLCLALDEAKGRLYGACAYAQLWYVYYWDLADGSFHGVLPRGATPLRDNNVPGPFEGTNLYNQIMFMEFGPDDPDKRYLYIHTNDSRVIHRLDLVDRVIWASSVESDGLRFISSGIPKGYGGWTLRMTEEGDWTTNTYFWNNPHLSIFKRIQ